MVQINTINKWIKDHPELCYQENVKEILCTACDIRIKQLKKDNIYSSYVLLTYLA